MVGSIGQLKQFSHGKVLHAAPPSHYDHPRPDLAPNTAVIVRKAKWAALWS